MRSLLPFISDERYSCKGLGFIVGGNHSSIFITNPIFSNSNGTKKNTYLNNDKPDML